MTLRVRNATVAWVMFCLVWARVGAANPLDDWQQRYPPFPVFALNAIAFGDGIFVAVGDNGIILTSSNSTDWAIQVSGRTNHLRGVAFGNGKFVAVGDGGEILVSPDAASWTAHPVVAYNLRAVTFGAGLFAAVSNNSGNPNRILTSSDGVAWTPRLASTQFVSLNCVIYAEGLFVAGGGPSFYSTNGVEWFDAHLTNGPPFSFPVQSLSYGNGLFLAHARYSGAISTNGKTWSGIAMEFAQDKHAAAYGAGHYVCVGENARFGYSRDGTNWASGIIQSASTFRGLVYGQGKFIAVGDYGRMFYSLDATNWSKVLSGPSAPNDLEHAAGKYVATDPSEGTVHTSSNLVQWQTRRPPAPLNELVFYDGKFVGVGNAGALAVSLDGLDWFASATPVATNLLAVASSSQMLVAVGNGGTVLSSIDGTNWVVQNSGTTNELWGIARGHDRFVAVGAQGTVIHATDGLAWQRVEIATRPFVRDVAFGKCRFVAVSGGSIFVSTNGADWFRPTFNTGNNSVTLASIAYGNGRFVACGYNSFPIPNSCVLSSSNGVNWSCHALPPYRFYGQVAFAENTFIIGVDSLLIQSDPIPAQSLQFLLSAMRDDKLEISVSGLPDTCCRLEAAPQLAPLTPWQLLDYLVLNSNGVSRHIESSFTNNPARFFRALAIP